MKKTFKIMFKEDHPRTITANLKLVPCYLRRWYKCGFFLIKACPICIIEQTKNLWQIPITYVELLVSCRCSLISAHCHLKWSCHHVILNYGKENYIFSNSSQLEWRVGVTVDSILKGHHPYQALYGSVRFQERRCVKRLWCMKDGW